MSDHQKCQEEMARLQLERDAFQRATERLMGEAKAAADNKEEILRKMRNQNNIISELKRSEAKLRASLEEMLDLPGADYGDPDGREARKQARRVLAGELK